MQIYFAPLEGVTGYVFRNAYEKYYGGIDKYFTPFISTHTKKKMDMREKRDILPENNKGLRIVPQVLTNKAEELSEICKILKEEYGYQEINLNLGCPSKTVTAKGKGSGFLKTPEQMEVFFDRFFSTAVVRLSIKTRIGYWETEESEELFRLYEKFPFEEVIVHPRLAVELYQGSPHYDIFETYQNQTAHTLCYNGDITSREELECLNGRWDNCDRFMLGRGLIARPGMLDKKAESELFFAFHDEIVLGYEAYMSGDRNTLFKMKELWSFWAVNFPEQERTIRQIKKAATLSEYRLLVNSLKER